MYQAYYEHRRMKPERTPLSRIRERDIQLAFIQLVQTSPEFRRWAIKQIVPDAEPTEFLGVSHSVIDYFGETDIEVRFRDENRDTRFILIECKVDASFQDDQIERYYKRGERYVDEGFCEDFSVALLAPEKYVENTSSFDGVISFEDITEKLDTLLHDSGPFFRRLFKKASAKEQGVEKETPLTRIKSRLQERLGELTQVDNPEGTIRIEEPQSRLKIYSDHPEHPDEVRYEVRAYFDEGTMISGIGVYDAPDDLHEQVYEILEDGFEGLGLERSQTELSDRRLKSQGLVKKTIPISEEPKDVTDRQVEEAATAVIELINHYHPKIIEES